MLSQIARETRQVGLKGNMILPPVNTICKNQGVSASLGMKTDDGPFLDSRNPSSVKIRSSGGK